MLDLKKHIASQRSVIFLNFVRAWLSTHININMPVARRCDFSPLSLVESLGSSIWRVALGVESYMV